MDRRSFLARTSAGLATVAGLAGCVAEEPAETETGTPAETTTGTSAGTTTGTPTSGTPSGTLTVATYSSFTGEDTAGNWLKSAFEEEYPGVTVEFTVPESGLNRYIQRKAEGASVEPDVFVGLNTGELVRADETLDESLFASVRDRLENVGGVKPGLEIDPDGRAVPYDTGYISLVYDEGEVDEPGTFDALTTPEYEGDLIVQNAQQSDPGRAFLLWTIAAKGEDGYLDYWSDLVDNGTKVLSDWEPAYNAYLDGEAPMVVSYSTDQVYYHGDGVDMSRHQVGFLNDQGYANPEAMAVFDDSDSVDLGARFVDFVLREESQENVASRNVQFPAVEGVDPGGDFSTYAYEPPNPVTFKYDELAGNVDSWIEQWARQIVTS
jgi:thiamine transport system substrate-binding protein